MRTGQLLVSRNLNSTSQLVANRIAVRLHRRYPYLADREKVRDLCREARREFDCATPGLKCRERPRDRRTRRRKPSATALPFISIVIPSFERQELLNDTLWSCLEQNYERFEIVVVDDASREPIEIPYPSQKIRLFRLERNQGESVARNYGIDKARGEYIKLLDSDDLFVDRTSLRHLARFARRTNADFIYCGVKLFDTASGRVGDYSHVELDERILRYRQLWPTQMLLRRELCDEVRFSQDIRFGEDWAFTLAVYRSGKYDIRFLPRQLVVVRLNSQSQSLAYGPIAARYFEAIEGQRRKAAQQMWRDHGKP